MENPLWGYIFKKSDCKEAELSEILGKVPIFDNLTKHELRHIEQLIHIRQYSHSEIVFVEDEPGVGLYIISKGAVKIYKKDPSGKEITLATLGEGQFFGELSLLDNFPRSATAITTDTSVLLGFFYPDLMDLIDRHPQLGCKVLLRIAQLVGERLRKTNELLQKHSL